jgi:hypothetical protein
MANIKKKWLKIGDLTRLIEGSVVIYRARPKKCTHFNRYHLLKCIHFLADPVCILFLLKHYILRFNGELMQQNILELAVASGG